MTPENWSPSEAIYRAAVLVRKAGVELDAVFEELNKEIDSLMKWSRFIGGSKDITNEEIHPDNGWICAGYNRKYTIKERSTKGPARTLGTMSLMVDLGIPDGLADALCHRALIIVGWAQKDDEPWVFGDLSSPISASMQANGGPLLAYTDQDDPNWAEYRELPPVATSWSYVLPLDALKQRDDIRSKLIVPTVTLLQGPGLNASDALREVPEALLFDGVGESIRRVDLSGDA